MKIKYIDPKSEFFWKKLQKYEVISELQNQVDLRPSFDTSSKIPNQVWDLFLGQNHSVIQEVFEQVPWFKDIKEAVMMYFENRSQIESILGTGKVLANRWEDVTSAPEIAQLLGKFPRLFQLLGYVADPCQGSEICGLTNRDTGLHETTTFLKQFYRMFRFSDSLTPEDLGDLLGRLK